MATIADIIGTLVLEIIWSTPEPRFRKYFGPAGRSWNLGSKQISIRPAGPEPRFQKKQILRPASPEPRFQIFFPPAGQPGT